MLKSYTSQSSTKKSYNNNNNNNTNQTYSRINTQLSQGQNKQNYQNINRNINQNLASIRDTIQMLKEYQKLCIQKQQFLNAQQTKQKIQFLSTQEKTIEKQRGVLKQQENVQNICKQGQQQVQKFQSFWDQTIQNLIGQLKQIQINAIKQHEIQLQNYKQKVSHEEPIKIKYSPKVLQLRRNLTNLIKARKYREAQQTKNKLKQLQFECEQQWAQKNLERQKILIQKLQKKHSHQLKALRVKLEGIFNQKIKQRDLKFQILLKRNRKRRIDSSKSIVKKGGQSMFLKSRSQSRVLKDSKISNCIY